MQPTEHAHETNVDRCPLHELRPLQPEFLTRPALLNRRLRDEAPVFQDPESGIYFISRYDDVVAMLKDHATFSSVMNGKSTRAIDSKDPEVRAIMADGYPNVPTMLTQDPPLQRRYRKFVDSAFSPANLKSLEPFMEQTSHALIDAFITRGECEFRSEFAAGLPLRVIASQIGTPVEDLPKLFEWTNTFIANLSMQLNVEGARAVARSVVEYQHYFVERLEERRCKPTDDILSKVVNARFDGELPLNNAECLSMLNQILVAGNETTASTLTEGMWLLINHPDQYELIRRNPSPEMISRFVEELLRVSSSSAHGFRRATQEVIMHGVVIPENAICFARFASANQDDDQFPAAMKFDIMRDNLNDHLAFGKGVHHCLGAALSRRELRIGFRVILQRLENFRLQPGAANPKFAPNALLHGLTALPLAFDVIN
jgi:cytochrome P450